MLLSLVLFMTMQINILLKKFIKIERFRYSISPYKETFLQMQILCFKHYVNKEIKIIIKKVYVFIYVLVRQCKLTEYDIRHIKTFSDILIQR